MLYYVRIVPTSELTTLLPIFMCLKSAQKSRILLFDTILGGPLRQYLVRWPWVVPMWDAAPQAQ